MIFGFPCHLLGIVIRLIQRVLSPVGWFSRVKNTVKLRILFGQWKRCGGRRPSWMKTCETINLFGNDWFRTKKHLHNLNAAAKLDFETHTSNVFVRHAVMRKNCASGCSKARAKPPHNFQECSFNNENSWTSVSESQQTSHRWNSTWCSKKWTYTRKQQQNRAYKCNTKIRICGVANLWFLEKKCYNGNCKRKNTDVSTCFTFSMSIFDIMAPWGISQKLHVWLRRLWLSRTTWATTLRTSLK